MIIDKLFVILLEAIVVVIFTIIYITTCIVPYKYVEVVPHIPIGEPMGILERIYRKYQRVVTCGDGYPPQRIIHENILKNTVSCGITTDSFEIEQISPKNKSSTTHLMNDGTIIITNSSDSHSIKKWFNEGMVKYLITSDSCTFPEFNDIEFIDTPKRSMTIHNAGGSSDKSEALSMQYMHDLYGVTKFIPEMEVEYWIEYKICDYLMRYKHENIGVSVTRAVAYPFTNEFTYDMSLALLNKKLYGLIVARNAISEKHKFHRCILHVWCMNQIAVQNLRKAYVTIMQHDANKSYDDVYVICSQCSHKFIYTNYY